jgi:hypothetical protein
LAVLIVRWQYEKQQEKDHKQCPKCAESIKRQATVCHYCRYQYGPNDDLRIV